MIFPDAPVIDYFQSFPVKVIWHSVKLNLQQSEDCVLWTGQKTTKRNGFVFLNKQRIVLRRFVYAMHNGELKHGQFIRNTCQNQNCLNPAHLECYQKNVEIGLDALLAECVSLYRSNLSINEISEKLALSRSWIEKLLKQARYKKLLLPIEAEGLELNESERNYYRNLGYSV